MNLVTPKAFNYSDANKFVGLRNTEEMPMGTE